MRIAAAQTPQQARSAAPKKGALMVQCDELWSFVDHKGNQQWVWLTLDAHTREMIGAYVGDRSEASAQCLWDSLPKVEVDAILQRRPNSPIQDPVIALELRFVH